MKLVPWIITDSHFFERDRVGRLVAALEATGRRLGLGVSENACVEIDLASGDLVGISAAESLLVDAGSLRRDGPARRDISARVIGMGDRLSLTGLLATPAPRTASRPSTTPLSVPDSSESRGAARSAALFTHAARRSAGVTAIHLEGWAMTAWPDGNGGVTFDIEP